jgi:hypothetical protein
VLPVILSSYNGDNNMITTGVLNSDPNATDNLRKKRKIDDETKYK